MLSILSSNRSRILTVVLLLQAALLFGFSRKEVVPPSPPLSQFPKATPEWSMSEEGVVEKEVMDVLKADDILTRSYVNSARTASANLFVAFFKSQRTGQAPHSPKNCLPGSGWVPSVSDIIPIEIAGRTPIMVNRYIVQKGDSASLVLYWYQSRDRVVASEYTAKYYVIRDAMEFNRTDTSLVRVIVPVLNKDNAAAMATATGFVQSMFPVVRQYLPS
ncbi:MAG: EpsI family protein [Acidobacteria bacterium]|nr:EpsI family protein [Acidobacteriota bacterium]